MPEPSAAKAPSEPSLVQCTWADAKDSKHVAIAEEEVTLTAVVKSVSSELQYQWDFDGDGTSDTPWASVTDPYVVEGTTIYPSGTGSVKARLTVFDAASGQFVGSDVCRVKVVEQDDKDIMDFRRKQAIEKGLWWLHTQLERSELTVPAEDGNDVAVVYVPIASLTWEYDQGVLFDAQAFVDAGFLATGDPDNPYTEDVKQMVNFVTSWLGIMPFEFNGDKGDKVGDFDPEARSDGPVGMVDGLGVWFASRDETEYGFGPALKLLATCGYGKKDYPVAFDNQYNFATEQVANLAQWNYVEIMQQMVDWIAWAQLYQCGNDYDRGKDLCVARDSMTWECTQYETIYPRKACSDGEVALHIEPDSRGGWPYEDEGWGWDYYLLEPKDRENGFLGDASVSYWTFMGLQAVDRNFELPYPDYVVPELESFLEKKQDVATGTFKFGPLDNYQLVERAGLGLSLMKWVGWEADDAPVQAAKNFISDKWRRHNYQHDQDHPNLGSGCLSEIDLLPSDCYAHFKYNSNEVGYWECADSCEWMKTGDFDDLNIHGFRVITEGLQAFKFKKVPDEGTDINYRDRYLHLLIDNQFPDGAWDDTGWIYGNPFGTAWAIQTLLML